MSNETQMLQTAAMEIRTLRNQNQLMRARLDMFDTLMTVLHTEPARGAGVGMSPDVVWEIEKYLETEKTSQKVNA